MGILKLGDDRPEHERREASGDATLARRKPITAVHFVLLCALALALVLVLAAGEGLTSTQAAHVTRYGQDVRIIDGDTLQVDGATIRLYGIDAPELDWLCKDSGRSWHCGRDAALKLLQ